MSGNKIYKYEMHVHTRPSGGGADIKEHIDDLIKKGYSGMVVTNHFCRGDSVIDKNLSWEQFVDIYRQDYLRGFRYAKDKNFDVLFGLEEQVGNGQEILVYGVTADFISMNPQLKEASAQEYAEIIHSAGGLVYQAHPYRARAYVRSPFPLNCINLLDGIEVYNAGNMPQWNELARTFAIDLDLACIAGSDAHCVQSAGKAGIVTAERLKDNETLVRVLKSREYEILKNE